MVEQYLSLGVSSPFYAFQNSDLVGQGIVVFLFFGSMFVWIIMVEKWLALSRAKSASEKFIGTFAPIKYPIGSYRAAEKDISPVARVCESGLEELLVHHNLAKESADLYIHAFPPDKLTAVKVEAVRSALERSVASQIMVIEENIGLLATAVSVSPFFGLFGTVWGVMMAFCGVAQQGSADISALAPGVSGALLTTVVGLTVAIPSLIGYNLLTFNIRKITVYMDNFVEEFMAKVKLEQLENE